MIYYRRIRKSRGNRFDKLGQVVSRGVGMRGAGYIFSRRWVKVDRDALDVPFCFFPV
jgi:hypothetical protein